jgi:hypothetical protein
VSSSRCSVNKHHDRTKQEHSQVKYDPSFLMPVPAANSSGGATDSNPQSPARSGVWKRSYGRLTKGTARRKRRQHLMDWRLLRIMLVRTHAEGAAGNPDQSRPWRELGRSNAWLPWKICRDIGHRRTPTRPDPRNFGIFRDEFAADSPLPASRENTGNFRYSLANGTKNTEPGTAALLTYCVWRGRCR